MYYRKHVSEPRIKRCRRTITVIIMLLLFLAANAYIHPIIESMLITQARQAFTDVVNQSVQNVIDDYSTDSFVTLASDSNGNITALQTDSTAVNKFKSAVSSVISQKLSESEYSDIEIPLGTLTGIDFLTGRGPSVKLRLIQKGSITAELASSFSHAGINQTCHSINCNISAEFYAVIPGFEVPVALDSSVIIAQSVIVGDTPDSYTYVTGDNSDTIGKIFDYGDPYGEDIAK